MTNSVLTKKSKLENFKLFFEELPESSAHPVDENNNPLAPLKLKRISRKRR